MPDPFRAIRQVGLGTAIRRLGWCLMFSAGYGRLCRAQGWFEPGFYRRQIHWTQRGWPLLHYLLLGWHQGGRPAPRYDPDRATAGYPYSQTTLLSPLEAYVLVGRFAGREYFAPDTTPPDLPDLPEKAAAGDAALVVHAHYEAEFRAIVERVAALTRRPDLYVTTSRRDDWVARVLHDHDLAPMQILRGPNRGRDMAPFAALLAAGLADRYAVIGKVHTKRSPHLTRGESWFRQSIDALLDDAEMARLSGAGRLGLLAPDGCLDGELTGRTNADRLALLCARSGLPAPAADLVFPHGGMFWARAAALTPLADLDLRADAFEAEAGQLDGTLAHAVERFIGCACRASGFDMAETGSAISAPDRRPPA